MIIPRRHDRLMLVGTLAGAIGVLIARSGAESVASAGLVLTAAGISAVLLGVVLKIRSGR